MACDDAAQHKDEEIEKDEVIQAVLQEIIEPVGIHHPVRIGPEMGTCPVEPELQHKEHRQRNPEPGPFHQGHEPAPQREEQIEPHEDDEKIDVVFAQPEEKSKEDMFRVPPSRIGREHIVVEHVAQGDHDVRETDAEESFFDKGQIRQRFLQGIPVEQTVAGNQEKCGDTVAAQDFTQKIEPVIGCSGFHHKVAHVDGDDAEHRNAAQVVKNGVAFLH